MKRRLRPAAGLALTLVAATAVSGCSIGGLNERPLPFTKGNGDGAITVTVEMANAVNLVPNSEVKVGDVTVGSVRKIEFANWTAKLTLGLEPDVKLPANVQAMIGQKSVLGAEYVRLAPPTSQASLGTLRDGANIPLSRSGRFPETEEVLAATSVVLNGSGLGQVEVITRELNAALHGREADARSLLVQMNTFVGTLDSQRGRLVEALKGVDALSRTFAGQTGELDRALKTLPKAVAVVRENRAQLIEMLRSLSKLSDVATKLIDDGRADLRSDLANLGPILKGLADAGEGLTGFLGTGVFPFPSEGLLKSARGDYLNLFVTIDITLSSISRDWLNGTPLGGVYAGLTGGLAQGPATDSQNPLSGLPPIKAPTLPGLPGVPLPTLPNLGGTGGSSGSSGAGGDLGTMLGGLLGNGGDR